MVWPKGVAYLPVKNPAEHSPQTFRRWSLSLVLVSLVCGLGYASQLHGTETDTAVFVDVAAQTGLDCLHFNGMTGATLLPEITGSGGALFDYDNDGDLDVYCVQGALLGPGDLTMTEALFPWSGTRPAQNPLDRLYRNDLNVRPDGSRQLRFTDVTAQSQIAAPRYGMGVATGDIDNDGWIDLYVTNYGVNQFFRNQGDGTFTDKTAQAQLGTAGVWSTSAAFFDYDRDGWLDLYVANYVQSVPGKDPRCYAPNSARDYCGPDAFTALPDKLFHNQGNGTFRDVSDAAGITGAFGAGLGVVTADFNADGWGDIYVANDGDPNQLWINQQDGTFKDEALWAGCAVNQQGQAEAGMGVDAADFDNDGDADLFMTHLMEETHTLYENLGAGLFADRTIGLGLTRGAGRYTAFGTGWLDYDNDSWLDLIILNGAVKRLETLARQGDRYPLDQPNQLFQNRGGKRFVEVSAQAGPAFGVAEVSRGGALGDLDNDGDTDVVVFNNNGPARVLLNQVGQDLHWLGLRLLGTPANRDMLGAQVEIVRPDGPALWRRVRTDGSYCSANDPRVVVGLGKTDSVSAVRVHWPDGQQETWTDVLSDRYITLRQGTADRGRAKDKIRAD